MFLYIVVIYIALLSYNKIMEIKEDFCNICIKNIYTKIVKYKIITLIV